MERKKIQLKPLPVGLNTFDDPRILLPNECQENTNFILNPDGSARVHRLWKSSAFDSIDKVLYSKKFDTEESGTLLLFVYTETGSEDVKVGYVRVENIADMYLESDLEMVDLEVYDMGKYYIPYIVAGLNKCYICNGTGDYLANAGGIITWDGKGELEANVDLFPARVGCMFQERLWYAGCTEQWSKEEPTDETYIFERKMPGVLYFTEAGFSGGISKPDNNIWVGNTEDPITGVVPLQKSLVILKDSEVWELVVPTGGLQVPFDDVLLMPRTDKAGATSPFTIQRNFDTIYFYNSNGAYIMNPQRVDVSPKRALEVSPGIFDVTRPIRKDFLDLNIAKETKIQYSDDDITTGDLLNGGTNVAHYEGIDDYDDFLSISIGGDEIEGEAYSKSIPLPSGYKWDMVSFVYHLPIPEIAGTITFGVRGEVDDILRYTVALSNDSVTRDNECTRTYSVKVMDKLAHESHLYWFVKFTTQATSANVGNYTKLFKVVVSVKKISTLIGSGFNNDIFYVFAYDKDGNYKVKMYNNGTWSELDTDGYVIYNLMEPLRFHDSDDDIIYSIVGHGIESGSGIIILDPTTEVTGNKNSSFKTGKLDLEEPDIPKKLRKIFITYKGSGMLYTYDETSPIVEKDIITLENKSDYGIKEISLNTERSKWFEFKVTATQTNFSIKDWSVMYKAFAPNEV